ncbi:hypothetical protein MTO96_024984 [Rhipicephalus appendiculatus]
MREVPDEESATCSNNLQRFLQSPGKSFVFTKGELCGGTPRKYRSEVVREPSSKQDRRAASEGLDPPDVSVKEERTLSSCHFQLATTPCRLSSSQYSDYSLWTTVSWATTHENEDAESTDAWGSLVKSSQPSWPCEPVAWKLVDRKAWTCEAFTVQDDCRPVTLKPPVKVEIARPDAEVPQFIYSRWPPAKDRTRWRRRVLFPTARLRRRPGLPRPQLRLSGRGPEGSRSAVAKAVSAGGPLRLKRRQVTRPVMVLKRSGCHPRHDSSADHCHSILRWPLRCFVPSGAPRAAHSSRFRRGS